MLFSRLAWPDSAADCSLCSTALFSGLICGAPHLIAVFCFGHWITSPRFAWIDFFWLLLQYWALGQTNSKRFLLAFYLISQVSFCLESSQAFKKVVSLLLFLLCCILLLYCAEILLMSWGLSCWFELLCCLMLCFMLFYACICLCHHVYLPPSDLFDISVVSPRHQSE